LDLSKDIFYEVMVERKGFTFPISIEYEGLPEFCTHCKSIGNNVNSCCWLHPRKADNKSHPVDNGKKPLNSQKQKHKWKPKDNLDGVGSSKAFEALQPKEICEEDLLTAEIKQEEVEDTTNLITQSIEQEVPVTQTVTQDVLLGNK